MTDRAEVEAKSTSTYVSPHQGSSDSESMPKASQEAGTHTDSPEERTKAESQDGHGERAIVYIKGWRLHTLTLSCDLSRCI